MLLYGRIPLMTSAQCIKRSTEGCKKCTGVWFLKDRYQVQFPVKNCCEECYNVIYNSVPLVLFEQAAELKKMGFQAYRFSFTIEGETEVKQILSTCAEIFSQETKNKKTSYKGDGKFNGSNFTTGHYKRGVE